MNRILLAVIGGFFMGGVVAVSNHMDYEDEQGEMMDYIVMVCAGHWKDYKNLGVQCGEAQADR